MERLFKPWTCCDYIEDTGKIHYDINFQKTYIIATTEYTNGVSKVLVDVCFNPSISKLDTALVMKIYYFHNNDYNGIHCGNAFYTAHNVATLVRFLDQNSDFPYEALRDLICSM